jgi:hypothetical protein
LFREAWSTPNGLYRRREGRELLTGRGEQDSLDTCRPDIQSDQ